MTDKNICGKINVEHCNQLLQAIINTDFCSIEPTRMIQ